MLVLSFWLKLQLLKGQYVSMEADQFCGSKILSQKLCIKYMARTTEITEFRLELKYCITYMHALAAQQFKLVNHHNLFEAFQYEQCVMHNQ